MIIVNISPTPYDNEAILVIKTQTDTFMKEVVRILDVSLPPFVYRQTFKVGYELLDNDSYNIYACGERTNEPVTCFKEVEVTNGKFLKELTQSNITKNFQDEIRYRPGDQIRFLLHPREEYGEQDMEIEMKLEREEDFVVGMFSKTVIYE